MEAKFLRPRLDHVSLGRQAGEAFAAAFRRRVTVVCAPAGYGKTTTTAAALEQCGHAAAWYKLDVLDQDPIAFLAAMVRALRRDSPEFGETLLRELESGPVHELSAELLAARLVSECDVAAFTQRFIVLDDYHEAADSPALNQVVGYLLANSPDSVRYVVLTRYEPAFPMEKLHLQGDVTRVGGDLLRFDADQVANVVRYRSGQDHDPEHIERLLALTEGWPASVVLAGMALAWLDAASLEAALADPRLKNDMYSYLAEQVFQRQSSETCRFLLRTCCLEHITVDLAERLAGAGEAHRHLRHLSSNRIFTFEADHEGAYRYHNLFRDFLRQRVVQDEGEAAFRALQRETAAALEASGDLQRAIELLLTANEPIRALDAIARGGEAGLERCPSDQLRQWLSRVYPVDEHAHPWMLILSGVLGARDGRFEDALTDLHRAVGMLSRTGDERGTYHALSITEWAEFWSGDSEASMATCDRALEWARTDAQRLHTLLSLMSAALDMRRWDAVEAASAKANAYLPRAQPEEAWRAAALRAHATFYQGDARSAHDLISRCHHEEQASGLKAAILNTHGMIDMALGQYESAESLLGDATQVAESYGHALASYMIQDSLACLDAARGRIGLALESLHRLRSDAAYVHEPTLLAFTLCHESTVLRRSGRIEASIEPGRLAVQAVPLERDPYLALNASTNLAFAEGLLGAPRREVILALSEQAGEAGLAFVELKAMTYAAILAFQANDRKNAVTLLENCIPRQIELGHINFVAQELCPRPALATLVVRRHRSNELGPSLLAALRCHSQFKETADALRRDCPSEVSTWLAQLSSQGDPLANARHGVRRPDPQDAQSGFAVDEAEVFPELTRRERQVLELMARDHANAEIAQELFLALGTVKTHVNHIMTKLERKTRVGAVLEYQRRVTLRGRPVKADAVPHPIDPGEDTTRV